MDTCELCGIKVLDGIPRWSNNNTQTTPAAVRSKVCETAVRMSRIRVSEGEPPIRLDLCLYMGETFKPAQQWFETGSGMLWYIVGDDCLYSQGYESVESATPQLSDLRTAHSSTAFDLIALSYNELERYKR